MKNLTPLSALFLIACGTSAPSTSSDTASSADDLGSAASAIRQLGKNDADVVAKCERLVQRCAAFAADSGAGGAVCDEISAHCADLAEQLSEARDEFQQCLEGVAECEASAANPADCRAQRAACNPAGKDFEGRRGATLECAERTQSCLPRAVGARGNGRAADADAGANQCDDNAMDFVGCCHGHGGGRPGGGQFGGADAGAGRPGPFGQLGQLGPTGRGPGAAGAGAGLPGPGMSPRPAGDHGPGNNDHDDTDDTDDTGANSGDGNR